MSILSTLSIGAQAVKAQQLGLQTTGHNLTNVATPGFSRQRVVLVSAHPSFEGGVFVGQGVDVEAVTRIVDRFVEAELLSLNGDVGFSEVASQALNSIQEIFPVSGGINGALGEFFGVLSDLANNPAGSAERISVIAKARALGENLAQTRRLLTSQQIKLDLDIQSATERVNGVLEQIAGLNRQIAFTEVRGESANDFRDQRQTLLQEITSLTGATVCDDVNGQVTVTVDGLLLVGGDRFASFRSDEVNLSGLHVVTYVSPDGTSIDASSLITAGKIGSVLNMRDNVVQDVIDGLDQFAKPLVDEINAQHAMGFDLAGNAVGNFFTPIGVVAGAAGVVQVDAALAAEPRLIAAAASADTVPGDNRNALALVEDADVLAYSDFARLQCAFDAALQSASQLIQPSLLDFLR